MKKNNTGHFETFQGDVFPQVIPHDKNGGETNQGRQPSINDIWDWFGHPEVEDGV